MNIAEILKNVPKGTKLYSPIFGEVEFLFVSPEGWIKCCTSNTVIGMFYPDGKYSKEGECMLFPSKDNRDWNKFSICPFKDGDIISKMYFDGRKYIAIFSHAGIEGISPKVVNYHCYVRNDGLIKVEEDYGIGLYTEFKLASEKEKEFLFKNLLENGYYWDTCIKKVKPLHPKFKVGDTICKDHLEFKILSIEKDRYRMKDGFFLMFTDQHEWETAKFDIKELKPFDKVLVRDTNYNPWRCAFFDSVIDNREYKFRTTSSIQSQCIPYNDDTRHLVGTKEDCPEYYKTW